MFRFLFLGYNFKNTIVIFESCLLGFALLQNLDEKKKSLSLGVKTPYLLFFLAEFENFFVILEISVLERVLMQSFVQKEILKFVTKND